MKAEIGIGETVVIRIPREDIQSLFKRGILERCLDNPGYLMTTKKIFFSPQKEGIKLKEAEKSGVSIWIDDWRDLFPKGNNSGGYPYRGDKQGCRKKMEKFMKENEFTKEKIFNATKKYVSEFRIRGFAYMKQAHYFIEKQGSGSTLAAFCEVIEEGDYKDKTILI